MKSPLTSKSRLTLGFQLFVLFLFVEIINAHALPCQQYLSPSLDLGTVPTQQGFGFQGYTQGFSPMQVSPNCANLVAEAPKPQKPRPVFFPYSVPIPWPTPLNGTNYAPVPNATRASLPVIPESLDEDTYPLLIPVPQFEFVPFYYNSSNTLMFLEPPTPLQESLLSRYPPQPDPPLQSQPQSSPSQPSSQGSSSPTTTRQTGERILTERAPLVPSPATYTQLTPSVLPPVTTSKLNPCGNFPSILPLLYVQSSAHMSPTFSLPPYLHSFIQPPPYWYPPRVPQTSPTVYKPESVTYASAMCQGLDDRYITLGPNTLPFTDATPAQPLINHSLPPSPPKSFPHYKPTPPTVTYGAETVTYIPPSPGTNDGYLTYGPSTITVTEDAPAPPTYNSETLRTLPNPPVQIGGRTSAIPQPSSSITEEKGYAMLDPETFTITEDDDDSQKSIVYGPKTYTEYYEDPFVVEGQPDNLPIGTSSGTYSFSVPEEEFFRGTPMYGPQRFAAQPPPSSYPVLLSNQEQSFKTKLS